MYNGRGRVGHELYGREEFDYSWLGRDFILLLSLAGRFHSFSLRSIHIRHSRASCPLSTSTPTLASRECYRSRLPLSVHQRQHQSERPRYFPFGFLTHLLLYSFGIFRLTDPPGLQAVLECTQKEAFHPHPPCPIYTVRPPFLPSIVRALTLFLP